MGCLSGFGFFRTYIGYILIVSKEQLLQSMGTGGIRKWDFATFVTASNSPEYECSCDTYKRYDHPPALLTVSGEIREETPKW